MSLFSIGSFSANTDGYVIGQSFKPNAPGINGSGSPGTPQQVTIADIKIGFSSTETTGRPDRVYIYSQPLTSVDQIGQAENLIADSGTSCSDGTGAFGSGTYYRQFDFSGEQLNFTSQYYAYFDSAAYARVNSTNP